MGSDITKRQQRTQHKEVGSETVAYNKEEKQLIDTELVETKAEIPMWGRLFWTFTPFGLSQRSQAGLSTLSFKRNKPQDKPYPLSHCGGYYQGALWHSVTNDELVISGVHPNNLDYFSNPPVWH